MLLKRSLRPDSVEDIVAERYIALRKVALRLTRGREADADDLLHDTFVRFILWRPPLDRIDNVDAYLSTMLRNVHVSLGRRHGREGIPVEAIEDGLLAAMVDAPDAVERLRVRDDLARIVERACERKRASKSASVLLLRCFYGYHPNEIAQLMRISLATVDQALHAARREARELIESPVTGRPGPLRLVRSRAGLGTDGPLECFEQLRARIRGAVEGTCLTPDEVVALYRPDIRGAVTSEVMAHLVSCVECLDRVNRHLGLSLLALRDPADTWGRNGRRGRPPRSGSGGGGASGVTRALQRARRTATAIASHVPQELRIVANGFHLGSQQVTSAESVQELTIRLAEPLAFIEVFDERGAILCYWPVQLEVQGATEESVTIEMGPARRLELMVSLTEDCPSLRVCYTAHREQQRLADRSNGVLIALRDTVDRQNARASGGERGWNWFGWPRLVHAGIVGALLVLWLSVVGPANTWAAVTDIGRAAVAALRTLFGSDEREPAPLTPSTLPTSRLTPDVLSLMSAPMAAGGRRPVFARPSLSASELADLEMDARLALHAIGADLGEDVALSLAPRGVTVRGVVGSAARRREIARALTGQRFVRVRLRTVDEAAAAARRRAAGGVEAIPTEARGVAPAVAPGEPVRLPGAIDERAALEQLLGERFPDSAEREAFVSRVLAHADRALARAWALRRLATRYSRRDVGQLPPRSREALEGLTRDHVGELRQALDGMSSLVSPVLVPVAGEYTRRAGQGESRARSSDARTAIDALFTRVQQAHLHAGVLFASAGAIDADATAAARELLTILHGLQVTLSASPFTGELLTQDP